MYICKIWLLCDNSDLELYENTMGKGQVFGQQKKSWRKKEKVIEEASGSTYFDWLIAKQNQGGQLINLCN